MTWTPAHDDVVRIHEVLVGLFAEEDDPISPSGIKNDNLLHSACERPNTGIGTHDKYSTIRAKASALFHSLAKNHAFHNGNKRTALVSLITTLNRNDYRLKGNVSDDELYEMVLSVTADEFPKGVLDGDADRMVASIATWLAKNTERFKTKPPGMKIADFRQACEQAGAQVRQAKGGSWIYSANNKSIRISMATSSLSGPVVRRYLKKLGLDLSGSGLDIDEFLEGASVDREQIRRYMQVLRRLAKT